ncbi:MAG: TadE/TadG family type IV pilus assembly protein [Pseudomonadota bacterium]
MTIMTRFKHIYEDLRGISAVEFALIAPVLIAVYLSSVELSFMLMADRRMTSTAATMADLVSRETDIDNCDVSDIFLASKTIIQPEDPTLADMRISSIENDGGSFSVVWSVVNTGASWGTRSSTTDLSLTAEMVPDNQTAVVAEISYPYSSVFGFLGGGTLTDTFVIRPRRTTSIAYTTGSTC